MKKLILIGTCALVTTTACNKDDSKNSTPTTDAKGYLTTGIWKMTDLTTKVTYGDSTYTFSDWVDVEDCDKDNFLKFNNDGTAIADQGAVKCDTSVAQTSTLNWELLNNNAQLKFNYSLLSQTVDIVELNATTLKYKISGQDVNGASYVATTTYGH